MKKLISVNGCLEYSIDEKVIRYFGDTWNKEYRNAIALEVKDTGNSVVACFNEVEISLDYAQWELLHLYFQLVNPLDVKLYQEIKP